MNFYDNGYKKCATFWGQTPAGFVQRAVDVLRDTYHDTTKLKAIDFGCGEGKNVKHIADAGINVVGIDISTFAISNARSLCADTRAILLIGDMRHITASTSEFDLVVSTGSVHCLQSEADIVSIINKINDVVKVNGFVVFSSFNSRLHDFSGHDIAFTPTLLSHESYMNCFHKMRILDSSDEDLIDVHPDNGIKHQHSITRIFAQRTE